MTRVRLRDAVFLFREGGGGGGDDQTVQGQNFSLNILASGHVVASRLLPARGSRHFEARC